MIQKHSISKFATKLKFKIYKPNKTRNFFFVCFDKHRHKQTELEIQSYIFSDHKPGLLLYANHRCDCYNICKAEYHFEFERLKGTLG